MAKFARRVVVVALLLGTLLAPAARADWVPSAVPEQTRFVMTGTLSEAFENLSWGDNVAYYQLAISPVTSSSASAAPFVADGDALVDVPLGGQVPEYWDYWSRLANQHAALRIYGFLVPDPSAPDGARFVSDRVEEVAAAPSEAEPMSLSPGDDPLGDIGDAVEPWVAATKMTAVWTETGPCAGDDGDCASGIVVGPDFAGASIQMTADGYTEDNWPAPTPGRSHTEGQIHITDLDGSELHLNFAGEKEFHEPAALYYAWVYLATGRFADVGTEGTFAVPFGGTPSVFDTGAGAGELILW